MGQTNEQHQKVVLVRVVKICHLEVEVLTYRQHSGDAGGMFLSNDAVKIVTRGDKVLTQVAHNLGIKQIFSCVEASTLSISPLQFT
ncbi:hypothetical protein K9N50_06555 [bacterium]|nr:hypothetical protein [bacterium]